MPNRPTIARLGPSPQQTRRQYDHDRSQIEYRKWYSTARWRKARQWFLAVNPLCKQCELEGYTTGATEVDHVVPHRGDVTLFWDSGNWSALCRSCHSKKTRGGA